MSKDHPWHNISSGNYIPVIAYTASGIPKSLKAKYFIKPHSLTDH